MDYIYPFASARQLLSDSSTRSNYNRWLDCAHMYILTKRKAIWMFRWRVEGQDGRSQVTAGVFTFLPFFFSSLLTYHSNIMIFFSFLFLSAAISFSFGIWLDLSRLQLDGQFISFFAANLVFSFPSLFLSSLHYSTLFYRSYIILPPTHSPNSLPCCCYGKEKER